MLILSDLVNDGRLHSHVFLKSSSHLIAMSGKNGICVFAGLDPILKFLSDHYSRDHHLSDDESENDMDVNYCHLVSSHKSADEHGIKLLDGLVGLFDDSLFLSMGEKFGSESGDTNVSSVISNFKLIK